MKYALHTLVIKLSGLAAILAAAAQSYLYLTAYDEAIQLYERNTVLPAVVYGVFILMMAGAMLFFCLQKKDVLPAEIGRIDRPVAFCALFSGMMIIASAVYGVMRMIDVTPEIPTTLRMVVMALSIPAACYFVASAWVVRPARSLISLLSLFVICWLACYLMDVYFLMDTSLNSPSRILRHMGLAALMIHYLYEVRYLLGMPTPRLYFGTGCAAIIMAAMSALPDVLMIALGRRVITGNSMYSLVMLAMALCIYCRMLSTLRGEPMEFRPDEQPVDEETAEEEPSVEENPSNE